MADSTPKSYHVDPALYLYTSLTSGSSHIITATSRLETILKANKIVFTALDVATDEKARMLWGRRSKGRKLPGLVRNGMLVGDLEQVEEWNEYGELKQRVEDLGPNPDLISTPTPSATNTPSKPPASSSTLSKPPPTPIDTGAGPPSPALPTDPLPAPAPAPSSANKASFTTALRQAGFEAAKKADDAKTKTRQDALTAAKKSEENLQKLDNSGPAGMPPPTGTTQAEDAKKPETTGTEVEENANEVPSTTDRVPNTEGATTEGEEEGIPSVQEAEESANKSIMHDDFEEVPEGVSQAEPPAPASEDIPSLAPPPSSDNVPSATEVDAAANKSIMNDRSHIVLKGKREEDRTPPSERANPEDERGQEAPKPVGETPLREVTATDEAQGLPGKKIQEQEAAKGEEAGSSVAD